MTTDNWFAIILFAGVYISCLLMLDGAHRAHIAALKAAHREQVAGLRSYIRTLSRERLWLEAEVQRMKDKLAERQENSFEPFQGVSSDFNAWPAETSNTSDHGGGPTSKPAHIQWLPPSEEYGEG